VEDGGACEQLGRRRLQIKVGHPLGIVETHICVSDMVGAMNAFAQSAALRPPLAANLEQIGEVVSERKRQRKRDFGLAVVENGQTLVSRAVPKVAGPNNMDSVPGQRDMSLEI